MIDPAVRAAIESVARPAVVAVSGYGGAGKSTLSRSIAEDVAGAVRLRGDDFLDPSRSHRRSGDWDGVGRRRMRHEVVEPFLAGHPVRYRPFDWSTRALGAPVDLPPGDLLVIDSIGIVHPDMVDLFALTIWVDVSQDDATRRGKSRDAALGRDHDRLWDEVWEPNDRDFDRRFDPRAAADLVVIPADLVNLAARHD